jgi:hypothetical protein
VKVVKTPSVKTEPIPLGKLELLAAVEYLVRSLREGAESDQRKADAFEQIAVGLDFILNQASAADTQSGRFLAILLAFLNKRKDRLQLANKEFQARYAKLESQRLVTKRSRGLREKIEEVLLTGNCYRQAFGISKRLMGNTRIDFQNDPAVRLPPPDYRSGDAVSKWSAYVYCQFRKTKRELVEQPGIGDLKRYQVDRKFQVSRVRPDIPNIVRRIFRNWQVS